MSDAFEAVTVNLLLADYSSQGDRGKINIIGGAISQVGFLPSGLTPPLHVIALLGFPDKLGGTECDVTIELREVPSGSVVQLPNASGSKEAVRIQHMVRIEHVVLDSGVKRPVDLRAQAQIVAAFQNGLPLTPGNSYKWKLLIDGQSRKGWEAPFSVLAPAPGPQMGGPAGSSKIEGVEDIAADVDDDIDD
jgi:hypothetical protein